MVCLNRNHVERNQTLVMGILDYLRGLALLRNDWGTVMWCNRWKRKQEENYRKLLAVCDG